ncbi:threonine--tRNA ligase [Candidatus Dependentiae bacterium Noda2021]|nr:threonine--tRNA ligase [Candidatus Dependentiae bacterium Noda2021]
MKSNNELAVLRHSAAHLLAQAVTELFPNTLLTIGPATEDGFFYDFLPSTNFKEEDLPIISRRMHEIVARNLPMTHYQMDKAQARELYKNNPFKLELIDQIPGDTVGIAQQGDFYDLCRGGHVDSTGQLGHFKLWAISGSYWRGNRENQALQRISGTAFFTAKELADYEKLKEEAALYDHRRLGKQMDLFSFHEEGVGFPFFHPKGQRILNVLRNYLQKLLDAQDYQEIATPTMLSDHLWQQSGHYQHYKNNMYFCTIDEKQYAIKPMNCPGAILVYKDRPHSYKELPLRLSEFGHVHRHELSGVLHGLLRVRAFTQDDAHIFCTPDQLESELKKLIELTYQILNRFNFTQISVALSTKPENALGSNELWEQATNSLKTSLQEAGIAFTINEGEGAFYGPKIEFRIKDSMGREWQVSTIQVDFFLPENFDLIYVASGGARQRPVMIHRAIYGSYERFLAILIEHFKGHFPFWLAPVQVKLLTITDAQKAYAQELALKLKQHGLRVEQDNSSDPLSGQIKTAQLEKIPWMIVIGQKEMDQGTITLRYANGKQEFGLSYEQFLEKAHHANNA